MEKAMEGMTDLKPRFKPGQEVWMPYIGECWDGEVTEITWTLWEVEYEVEIISEMGHQAFETCSDTEDNPCPLFTNKEECENWINKS